MNIDLRSDTVTLPTEEMRWVIASAPVGDDVFGEDPSVNELEEYIAKLFGKESAIFVPSGTMANQIALAVSTNSGDEVIVEADSHIFYYEAAAPAILSNVQLRPIKSEKGEIDTDEIKASIRTSDIHFPRTSLICIENTHNRHGGRIISLDYIKKLEQIAGDYSLKLHCDGARVWESSAATGISLFDYAKPFDTISVALSKGLGAPSGSLLLGSKEIIARARKWRKVFGGGMRQSGLLAAAGLYAVKEHFKLLQETHKNAKTFAKKLSLSEHIDIDIGKVETNIVFFRHRARIMPGSLQEECRKNGLLLFEMGNKTVRAVFHFQISKLQANQAADIVRKSLHDLVK